MNDPRPARSDPATPATPDAPPEAKFEWQHSPFEQFLERHFVSILIGIAIVAVATAGVLVWRQQTADRLKREAQAFTAAESVDDYQKVISEHPGSAAAGSAQLMIAHAHAQNAAPAEAIAALEEFVARYPEHPLQDHAAFRIAVLTLAQGDTDGGIEKLDAFLRAHGPSELAPLARLRKGDALAAAGKPAEAETIYKELLADKSFAGSPFFQEAESRVAQIKLKPPVEVEFVPEPEPKPEAGAPPVSGAPAPPVPTPEITAPSLTLDGDPAKPDPGLPEPVIPAPPKPDSPIPQPDSDPAPAPPPKAPEGPPPSAPAPVTDPPKPK